jgi:hypothetical protein
MSLDMMCHNKWFKCKLDQVSGSIVGALDMSQANALKFCVQFKEFRLKDFKDKIEAALHFFTSRKIFPSLAIVDMERFFQRWSQLVADVMDIYDGSLSAACKQPVVDALWSLMDNAFRKVVSEGRKFNHDNFTGDEAMYYWGTTLVGLVVNRPTLTTVFPLIGIDEVQFQSRVHSAVKQALATSEQQYGSIVSQLKNRIAALEASVFGTVKRSADDMPYNPRGGSRGRRGGRHAYPGPPGGRLQIE